MAGSQGSGPPSVGARVCSRQPSTSAASSASSSGRYVKAVSRRSRASNPLDSIMRSCADRDGHPVALGEPGQQFFGLVARSRERDPDRARLPAAATSASAYLVVASWSRAAGDVASRGRGGGGDGGAGPGQDRLKDFGRGRRLASVWVEQLVGVAVSADREVHVVGVASSGHHRVERLAGFSAGDDAVHGVSGEALGAVDGRGVPELNVLGDVRRGQRDVQARPRVAGRRVIRRGRR